MENGKIATVRASMVVNYYTKHFHTGADRHKGILMFLFLLVTETKIGGRDKRARVAHRRALIF